MTRPVLLVLLGVALLGGCDRGTPKPVATMPASHGLEAAAIEAGVIPDPANTDITGLYASETDRVCIVPSATAYRIGVFVGYDEQQNCGGSGSVTRASEVLHIKLGNSNGSAGEDAACSFDARFDGDRVVFPARVPAGCQKLCLGRASVAALDVARLSESGSEASTLRDAKGRLLCTSGG